MKAGNSTDLLIDGDDDFACQTFRNIDGIDKIVPGFRGFSFGRHVACEIFLSRFTEQEGLPSVGKKTLHGTVQCETRNSRKHDCVSVTPAIERPIHSHLSVTPLSPYSLRIGQR